MGDPGRLRQVLLNLVGNAIKFTEEGAVVVSARVTAQSGDRVKLHFTVTDTGIGIPRDKRTIIFEPFTQAEDSTTRRFGGTGLGLAISSRLVQLMGGEIWVDDGPGGIGSAFHFTIEAAIADEPALVTPVPRTRPASKLRVLLAEDNAVNQLVAVRLLEKHGHEVTLARNGREAVECVARHELDLVLMDLEMPELDGIEATRLIRQSESARQSRLPIIAMTAHAMKQDEMRCLSAGMDAFVSKPINPERLLHTIQLVVGDRALTSSSALERDAALLG